MYTILLSVLLALQFPDSTKAIYGQVNNEKGEALHQASVYITESKVGTQTDKDGNYTLTIPDSLLGNDLVIRYSYVGMADKTIRVKNNRLPKKLNVRLKECFVYIETMVVPRNKKESKQRDKAKRRFERMNPCK